MPCDDTRKMHNSIYIILYIIYTILYIFNYIYHVNNISSKIEVNNLSLIYPNNILSFV